MFEGLSLVETIVVYRTVERIAISAVVILVAFVVTLGFWRSIQKVEFDLSRDKLGGSANLVLATPVFALLALIGFSWVSFSNPIAVSMQEPGRGAPASAGSEPTLSAPLVTSSPTTLDFTGMAAMRDDTGRSLDIGREEARSIVRSLNCFAEAASDRLENERERANLDLARLAVLAPVWNEAEWGDFESFHEWVRSGSGAPPGGFFMAIWEERHLLC